MKHFGEELQGCLLKAECVQVSNCILVQEPSPDTSAKMMQLYFENEKSGGGKVAEIQYNGEERKAIVTFEDWKGTLRWFYHPPIVFIQDSM